MIDEWQGVSPLWDVVRFEADKDNKKGKHILTRIQYWIFGWNMGKGAKKFTCQGEFRFARVISGLGTMRLEFSLANKALKKRFKKIEDCLNNLTHSVDI